MRKMLYILAIVSLASCEGELIDATLGQMLKPACAWVKAATQTHIEGKDGTTDDELAPYLNEFVLDAESYGIDISYVYDQKITLVFTDNFESRLGGMSVGYKKDEIRIFINAKSWEWYNDFDKKALLYHELGHDVFDMKHFDNELLEPGILSLDENRQYEIFDEFWNDALRIYNERTGN